MVKWGFLSVLVLCYRFFWLRNSRSSLLWSICDILRYEKHRERMWVHWSILSVAGETTGGACYNLRSKWSQGRAQVGTIWVGFFSYHDFLSNRIYQAFQSYLHSIFSDIHSQGMPGLSPVAMYRSSGVLRWSSSTTQRQSHRWSVEEATWFLTCRMVCHGPCDFSWHVFVKETVRQ